MPVFEKNPDKSVSRLQKRPHQGMVKKVGQMYEIKDDNPMVKEFKTTKKELEKSKTELAGAILREREVVKRYQRLVKRVHAFYVAAFQKDLEASEDVTKSTQDLNNSSSGPPPDAAKQGVEASDLLELVTESAQASDLLELVTKSAQDLNISISGRPPAAEKNKEDEKAKDHYHFQPAPKEGWKMSHEWREDGKEKDINDSTAAAAALAILRSRSYDRIDKLETKICLLCLSIFPDNYVLKKRLLIYWWIGEGIIVEQSDPVHRTAEEVGEEIFEELIREGVIVARKDVGNEIPEELIKEGGIVTSEGLGDELFKKLIKNGVIVAKKDQVGDQTIREGEIVATKDVGNEIPKELIKEGGIVTSKLLGDEWFDKLIKNGVIVEKITEGVYVSRKDYSACPIVNRCSMNPWIRDMLVSVAKEACFFDFDPSGKPSPFVKSLRSCLVSCDPDALFLKQDEKKKDPATPPSASSPPSSPRSFAKSCFSWLVSRHPNTPPSSSSSRALKKEDSSGTPSDSSAKSCPNIPPSSSSSCALKKEDSSGTPSYSCAKSCCSLLVSRAPNIPPSSSSSRALKKEDSSGTPSDSCAKSCCSLLVSRAPNIPLSSSSSSALKKEDSSGTPSTKSHDQNIPSASSPSGHDSKEEASWKDTLLYFAKSCCSCLVSHNQDSKEEDPPKEKPKEEDLVSVFNVSEDILEFKIDWLSKLKSIEVLQLGRWRYWCEHHIEVENDQVFKSLGSQKFLKYLSLRGISRITFLPASLSGLINLEILDLKACHNLETLPDISSLKKLTHLDLSECYLLESMPEGIAKLTSLQVLKGFVIGNLARNTSKHKTSKLKDLAKLAKLRRLSIVLQTDDQDDNYDTLNAISSLRCLTITWSPKKPVQEHKGKETKLPNQETVELPSNLELKEQETEEPPMKQETKEQLPNQEPKVQEIEELPSKQETEKQLSNQELNEQETEEPLSKQEPKEQLSKQKSNKEPFPFKLPEDLTKLDLRGIPLKKAPKWLNPRNLTKLKKLYLRGGKLESLAFDNKDGNGKWGVEILRLKFMENFKTDFPKLEETFPKMNYLEKIDCWGEDIIWSKGEKVRP